MSVARRKTTRVSALSDRDSVAVSFEAMRVLFLVVGTESFLRITIVMSTKILHCNSVYYIVILCVWFILQSDESWSDLPASSTVDRRVRASVASDLDDEARFAVPAVHDEHLVLESQYTGADPPEFWGLDGEFTFVPRRDCRYYYDVR